MPTTKLSVTHVVCIILLLDNSVIDQKEDLLRNFYSNDFTRRRQWHPTPVLLPGKSHGPRSLVGGRLWGRTESDTTEVT